MKKKKMLSILICALIFTTIIPLSKAAIVGREDPREIYDPKQEPVRVASGIIIGKINGGYDEQSRTIDAVLVYIFCTMANKDLRGFYSGELKIGYHGILTDTFICASCCIYPGGW